ncbi:MAG: 2,3-bisphosphoglycerate-independent phosphoglycerate mutase [Eubacteriales bacterium]|nr:2,3-bisphosphoglycerate-independent phosphoglycerate mutase [Eubacteriales bacterium]
MSKKPTVLMILDGYGLNEKHEANAVYEANTPVMDKLMAECPYVKGYASGLAVGLPDGQMGNSEVGHLNMGAGRIVYQELTRITKEIQDGDFFKNEALLAAMKNAKENNSAVHFMGLLSDGGVHSHNTHLYGLLEMAKKEGLEKVYVHCFLDGRDTPPSSGKSYIQELQAKMKEIGVGEIGVVSGRYYAMDRDNRWDRVELAYNALTKGEGVKGTDAAEAVQASYDDNKTDEFVMPTVIEKDGKPVTVISDKDSVIFFNFRPDRAREITRAFCDDEFHGFDRAKRLDLTFVCFTDYDDTIQNKLVAFHKVQLHNTFGEYLAAHNMTQARIAETEKYAHVTFFFNGGVEEPNKGEDRILVNSPKVATYDLQPEMSAPAVCDKLVEAIKSQKYDVIIINFANPDMVGHTGIENAAVAAVEAVDHCVGRAVEAIQETDGQMFICADHGNAEQLLDYSTGEPFTAHTTNPVPFILVNADPKYKLRENGCLADIVPTLIELMGMEQPEEMTGKSLLIEK